MLEFVGLDLDPMARPFLSENPGAHRCSHGFVAEDPSVTTKSQQKLGPYVPEETQRDLSWIRLEQFLGAYQ